MDRYTRGFIFASLVYLAAGGVMGAAMWLVPASYGHLRFAHIHVLLAGFMAMMIFGVGYFILPRFAARTLEWPGLVGVHFWLANVSLVAMVVAEPLSGLFGAPAWALMGGTGAVLQAVSFLMFAGNLGVTLVKASAPGPVAENEAPAPPKRPGVRSLPVVGAHATPSDAAFGPETTVAAVVDRKDGARELLVEAGLRPLQDPAHLDMIRARGVTLGHACQRHGIPLPDLLSRLSALPDRSAAAEVGPDRIIGDLVARHPATRDVLLRRFGAGCFTCPGFSTETLAQGALMHGVPVEDLLADLRRAIEPAGETGGR